MAGKRTTRHDPASHLQAASARWAGTSYKNAPTKSVSVGGTRFVYRELGIDSGVPVIFVNHLAANLDNWDPRVVDGIAAKHRVITFDNRGLGGSEGKTPDTVEAMAQDAVAFIRALGFDQVDLLGFSLGGLVSQVIAQQEPALVRKIILAGTGPAGGEGIVNVTKLSYLDTFHAFATLKDPKELLFFTNGPWQVAGQSVHQAVEGAHERPRQGDGNPGIPHAAQGDPRLGSREAGRPLTHPTPSFGGQR